MPFRLRGGQAVAVDVSLAALLGEGVYNFGELLLHPIVTAPRLRSAGAYLLQRCSAMLHGACSKYGMQTHPIEILHRQGSQLIGPGPYEETHKLSSASHKVQVLADLASLACCDCSK